MIVLDTHTWIWWNAAPDRLSRAARRKIDETRVLGLSVISCWEVAMLVAKGRLRLDREVELWVRQAVAKPRMRVLPITPKIAVRAAGLGEQLPGDPADRLITASCLDTRSALVTRDQRLASFEGLATVW